MAPPNVTFLHPSRSVATPGVATPGSAGDAHAAHAAHDARFSGESAFWTGAIGVGVNVVVAQIADIDTLAQRIEALAPQAAGRRPVVGQYLDMVKMLASGWPARSRPALLMALAALRHYSDSLVGHDAELLAGALGEMAVAVAGAGAGAMPGRRASAGATAARVTGALIHRLDFPVRSLDAVNDNFGSYLAQMAVASNDLETDTVLVTQRLQAEHVHAYTLAQQVSTVQARLDEARTRQQGHWPLGSHADLLREEIAAQSAALDSARRQLDQLRAGQAATLSEASCLQTLLPTLSAYLAGVDRMSAGINAALSGALALQVQLSELNQALLAAPQCAGSARTQLAAALPNWRNVSLRLQHLDHAGAAR